MGQIGTTEILILFVLPIIATVLAAFGFSRYARTRESRWAILGALSSLVLVGVVVMLVVIFQQSVAEHEPPPPF